MTTFVEPPFWACAPSRYASPHVGLSLYSAPATEPLSVAEVKAHLRIDASVGEPAPASFTGALAGAGAGNVDNGAHRYLATFVTADGETDAGAISAAVTIADKTVNGQVALSGIPIGGAAVTARKLYRTTAGGAIALLLATLNDNTTTTYVDNLADASLGAQAPTTNSTNDASLLSWIAAARQYVEMYTDLALVTQTWRQALAFFPRLPIVLAKRPVQSAVITYVDLDGVTQTLATSEYALETPAGVNPEYARIVPVYAPTVYPVTPSWLASGVTVQFVAGFGAAAAVPALLKACMKELIRAHWLRQDGAASQEIMDWVTRQLDAFAPVVLA